MAKPAADTTGPGPQIDAAVPDGVVGRSELERRLQVKPNDTVAVLNTPVALRLKPLTAGRPDPGSADVVIGFATRKPDLVWLKPAYSAARSGRLAWLCYPRSGRPGTDLPREWLIGALQQYGVATDNEVPIDLAWSALRLKPDAGRAHRTSGPDDAASRSSTP